MKNSLNTILLIIFTIIFFPMSNHTNSYSQEVEDSSFAFWIQTYNTDYYHPNSAIAVDSSNDIIAYEFGVNVINLREQKSA